MPVPAYKDLVTPTSVNSGLMSETKQERILSLLAMLASGKAPDGTALPTTGVTLPPPVTTGTTIQTYTDPNTGDVWVAMNGVNGGAWKRPDDVLHGRYYRAGAYNFPATTTVVGMDTLVRDPYGLYVVGNNGFTVPIAGQYLVTAIGCANPTATGQWAAVSILCGGSTTSMATSDSSMTFGMQIIATSSSYMTAGQTAQMATTASPALAGQPGGYQCVLTIDYQGTG